MWNGISWKDNKGREGKGREGKERRGEGRGGEGRGGGEISLTTVDSRKGSWGFFFRFVSVCMSVCLVGMRQSAN